MPSLTSDATQMIEARDVRKAFGHVQVLRGVSLSVAPGDAEEVLERARLLALPGRIIGRVQGEALVVKGEPPLPLSELRAAHEGWLPGYMAAGVA